MNGNKLPREFYICDGLIAAEKLIGKILVHNSPEGLTSGRIVELEAYMGEIDKACHAYGGRKTNRTAALYREGGCAYVYLIYGIYNCLNIVVNKTGIPQCILIRALEPVEGIELMKFRRKTDKLKNLCSGPGKLCLAMGITREHYGEDLCGDKLWLEDDGNVFETVKGKRIGINYAEEAIDYEWRFAVSDSKFLSAKI